MMVGDGRRPAGRATATRQEAAMQPPDQELLDFDTGALEDWDERRARTALDSGNGTLYRNHLQIALALDRWAEAERERTDADARHRAGYVQALEDMAAYLRQTCYLPEGGPSR
jgi:hypothetical protein